MIQFFHVTKTYGRDLEALADINFHVQKGEFVFIAGPSGAGKTTLLRLIFRDELPTSGQILVNGRNVVRMPERAIPQLRRSIGVIFQDFKLLRDRSIAENLALVYRVQGNPPAVGKRKVANLLRLVGLSHKVQMTPYKLSGGEQQRVAIARALMNDPLLLLADEPTGDLDADLAVEVMRLLSEINARGTTVVVATHDMGMVREMGRRTFVLKAGRVVEEIPEDSTIRWRPTPRPSVEDAII
jgi:cell division transport system ATP-binding protein